MAETINNKPTIQIRGLPSSNGTATTNISDKSPSPATKLLINHGKPNFTIQRSPKVQDNDNENPLSPQPNANNNYNAYKSANSTINKNYNNNIISTTTTTTTNNNNNNNNNDNGGNSFVVGTKFNGVFKPSNVGNWATANGEENEATKVVLRRPKVAQAPELTEGEDENVPEFIRRQRRIQERLAKENVLDFENRRSGYFTHVMISPDSPNRTSFVQTMASPAIVPALEIPPPFAAKIVEEEPQQQEEEKQVEQVTAVVTSAPLVEVEVEEEVKAEPVTNGHSEPAEESEPITNGHGHQVDDVAPEDVAEAIEQVNQAVAGEEEAEAEAEPEVQSISVTSAPLESQNNEPETPTPAPVEASVEIVTPNPTAVEVAAEVAPLQNGNGQAHDDETITISHTNGHTDGPRIPSPDPSGALGVNFEPKTVVSFSQELGGGENNYPDVVKVVKDAPTTPADGELKELTKLKFDIQSDDQNEVQVTPVLRTE